jgi:hypothetical protein
MNRCTDLGYLSRFRGGAAVFAVDDRAANMIISLAAAAL